MKKTIAVILLFLLLTVPLNTALASGNPSFSIMGQTISDIWTAAFTDDNGLEKQYLMVPLRDIATALGLTVTWYPNIKTATIKPVENEHIKKIGNLPVRNCMYFSTTIIFKDDSNVIGFTDYFSSASKELPGNARATIKGDKMYVPSEVFTHILGIR